MGGAERVRVLRRKVCRVFHQDLFSPLGMGAESEKRPQQMVCYRPGDEPEGLDVGGGGKSEDLWLTSLLPWLEWPGFPWRRVPMEESSNACWSWGLE